MVVLRNRLRTILIIVGCVYSAIVCAQQDANRYYVLGNEYFKQQNYDSAIVAYHRALNLGMRTGRLYHNLGVVYYKAGHYVSAEQAFLHSSLEPKMAPLSYLNLGLTSIKQDKLAEAEYWLEKAVREGPEPVRKNAEKLLNRVYDARMQEVSGPDLFVFVNTGVEDNAIGVNELDPAAGVENAFTDLTIYYSKPLKQPQWQVNGSAFFLKNDEVTTNDLILASVGIGRAKRSTTHKVRYGTNYNYLYLDQDPYQHTIELFYDWSKPIRRKTTLDVRYTLGFTKALDTEVDFVNGTQHKLRFTWKRVYSRDRYDYVYEFEYNDRVDDFTDAGSPNFSPLRNRVRIDYRYRWTDKLRSLFRGEFRRSTDSLADGTDRTDDREIALTRLVYQYSKQMEIGLEYEYFDQNSSDDAFTFDRNRFSLVFNWIRQ